MKHRTILTKREMQVLELVMDGHSTQQIADALYLSPHTVETHRKMMRRKTKTHNMHGVARVVLGKHPGLESHDR